MKVFSHRGDTREAPGNTLLSITQALEKGHSIEVDLRISSDGELFLNHDPNIEVLNKKISIQKTSSKEIKSLNEKAEIKVLPKLDEALKLFTEVGKRESKVALHLKDYYVEGIEKKVVKVIRSVCKSLTGSNLFDKLFVFDVSVKNARRIKEMDPRVRVGLSVGESDFFPNNQYPTIYDYDMVRELEAFDVVWADEWKGGLYTSNFFEECKSDGYSVFCVSPELHSETDPSHPKRNDYESYWKKMIRMGAQGICTDYPTLFKDKVAVRC